MTPEEMRTAASDWGRCTEGIVWACLAELCERLDTQNKLLERLVGAFEQYAEREWERALFAAQMEGSR
jgi:hypothetical protein